MAKRRRGEQEGAKTVVEPRLARADQMEGHGHLESLANLTNLAKRVMVVREIDRDQSDHVKLVSSAMAVTAVMLVHHATDPPPPTPAVPKVSEDPEQVRHSAQRSGLPLDPPHRAVAVSL